MPSLLDNANCSKEVMALDRNIAASSTPVQTPNCTPVSMQEQMETAVQQEMKYCYFIFI